MTGQPMDDVLLRDGTIARIGPVTVSDPDALVALHERLSERSRYLRFFHLSELSAPEFVDRVVQDDIFGPLVRCGYGGVNTELFADRTFRLRPRGEAPDPGLPRLRPAVSIPRGAVT